MLAVYSSFCPAPLWNSLGQRRSLFITAVIFGTTAVLLLLWGEETAIDRAGNLKDGAADWKHSLENAVNKASATLLPACPSGDLTLPSGECVSRADKGQVFYDPCNPVGKQVVRQEFRTYNNRPDALSPGIGSLERHRLFCLLAPTLLRDILEKRSAKIESYDPEATVINFKAQPSLVPVRVLAFAPQGEESVLRVALDAASEHGNIPVDFIPADLNIAQLRGLVGSAALEINSEKIPFPDKFFDLVMFSHILEHVDDMEASISEISRVLRDDGFAVLSAPIFREDTLEDKNCVTEECRKEKFGQKDHVRRPGWDVLDTIRDYFADTRNGKTADLLDSKFGDLGAWFKNSELSSKVLDVYLYAFKSPLSSEAAQIFL